MRKSEKPYVLATLFTGNMPDCLMEKRSFEYQVSISCFRIFRFQEVGVHHTGSMANLH